MKQLAGILFLLSITLFSYGQSVEVRGIVQDFYLHQPIEGAMLSLNGKRVAHSNERGEFIIKMKAPAELMLLVNAKGYTDKKVIVAAGEKRTTISLESVNYQTSSVQVRGLYSGNSLLHSPGSIGNLVSKDLERSSLVNFSNTFNLIPGARLEFRNSTTGARIILRGYGNQNNNNGIGYKAYYNDIPITDADGTTVLDDIDFATLGRVEVFKGPVSSVYGTGIGGVVNMMSAKAPEGITVSQSLLTGSNDLLRSTTAVGVGTEKTNVLFNYDRQQTDGWRLNDDSRKNFWSINADLSQNRKSRFTLFAGYTKSMDQIPGQVDSFGLVNYPDTAELTNIKNNSRNELKSTRMALTHEYFFSRGFSNKTTVFFSAQDNDQWVSTLVTKTNKNTIGGRTAFNLDVPIGNVAAKFTLGTEVIRNIIFQQTYSLVNGIQGTMRSNQQLKPVQWNVFGKVELTLAKRTQMVFSAAANFIEYVNIDDYKPVTGTYVKQTGSRTFTPLITPRWVINHLISKHVSVYANYSMGFGQPASNQIIITQTGQVNRDLKPEISNTFEVGLKASLFKESLYIDFAYYNMDVSDKIVPQNFAAVSPVPAYVAFVNSGTVNMKGAELTVNYVFKPASGSFIQLVRPFFNYQYNGSRNIDLKNNNNNNTTTKDYSNYHVSGLALNTLNAGIDIEAGHGFYVNVTDMYSDKMPITLDNTVYADSYNLVNVKAGLRKSFGGRKSDVYSFDIFGGINNAYDTRYAQFVVINLVPVAGQPAPKYFSPGPPSQLYGGVSLRYRIR